MPIVQFNNVEEFRYSPAPCESLGIPRREEM